MRQTLCFVGFLILAGCADGGVGTPSGDDDALPAVIDGSLDETFGTGGIASADFGGEDSFGAVLALANGTILAAGTTRSGALLARYTATGALDTSFGDQGRTIVEPGSSGANLTGVGLQSDGRIIVAGNATASRRDFLVSRFSEDGRLDPEFGNDGFVLVDFNGDDDAARCLMVLQNDRILLGGYARNGAGSDLAMVRLTPDGGLDATFGTDGKVDLPIGAGEDWIEGIALDSSGRIAAAGFAASTGGIRDWLVARFTADGVLDSSFGTAGRVVLTSEDGDQAYDVTVLPNDDLVVVGVRYDGEANRMALAKLDSAGVLVSSFGAGGWAFVDFGGDVSGGTAVLRQADGGLLVAGVAFFNSIRRAAIARVDATGALDPTLDRDGKRTIELGTGGEDRFRDLSAQPDGKIIAAGHSRNTDYDAVLVRFDI